MKTWADLKHGDVLTIGRYGSRLVIDVLQHSVLLSALHDTMSAGTWYSIYDLEKYGAQIVQPEEEVKPKNYVELITDSNGDAIGVTVREEMTATEFKKKYGDLIDFRHLKITN